MTKDKFYPGQLVEICENGTVQPFREHSSKAGIIGRSMSEGYASKDEFIPIRLLTGEMVNMRLNLPENEKVSWWHRFKTWIKQKCKKKRKVRIISYLDELDNSFKNWEKKDDKRKN